MSWDEPLLGALRVEWEIIGSVTLDQKGKVSFPKAPSSSGLYQFRVERLDGSEGRYVGESDDLNRRFGHYRNPGPTQPTNLRMNALFKELLTHGHSIKVAIATGGAWILRNNREELANLNEKHMRRLFENFVLVMGKGEYVEEINK
jgi:hypothetical protein